MFYNKLEFKLLVQDSVNISNELDDSALSYSISYNMIHCGSAIINFDQALMSTTHLI